jgi:hypothetical protein
MTADFTKFEIHKSDGTVEKCFLDLRKSSHQKLAFELEKAWVKKHNPSALAAYAAPGMQPSKINFGR